MLGGTGCLGSKIVKVMVKAGHSVLCLVRSNQSNSDTEGLKYCRLNEHSSCLKEYQPDIFINCACCYLKDGKTDKDVLEANFIVPARLLQECVALGCKRVITMGTALPDNFNMYSYTKKLFADLGMWYANTYQLEFLNLKLESFYGEDVPQDRFLTNTIWKLLQNEDVLLTKGLQKRDFIYITDVVDNVLMLMNRKTSTGYAEVPIGTGEAASIREVVEYLHVITKSRSKLVFGAISRGCDEPDTVADKQAMLQWGIKTRYQWKEGMEHMTQCIREKSYTIAEK